MLGHFTDRFTDEALWNSLEVPTSGHLANANADNTFYESSEPAPAGLLADGLSDGPLESPSQSLPNKPVRMCFGPRLNAHIFSRLPHKVKCCLIYIKESL